MLGRYFLIGGALLSAMGGTLQALGLLLSD